MYSSGIFHSFSISEWFWNEPKMLLSSGFLWRRIFAIFSNLEFDLDAWIRRRKFKRISRQKRCIQGWIERENYQCRLQYQRYSILQSDRVQKRSGKCSGCIGIPNSQTVTLRKWRLDKWQIEICFGQILLWKPQNFVSIRKREIHFERFRDFLHVSCANTKMYPIHSDNLFLVFSSNFQLWKLEIFPRTCMYPKMYPLQPMVPQKPKITIFWLLYCLLDSFWSFWSYSLSALVMMSVSSKLGLNKHEEKAGITSLHVKCQCLSSLRALYRYLRRKLKEQLSHTVSSNLNYIFIS